MPEITESIQWRGGLNTATDKALIAEGELAGGMNFIVRDGTLRLDRRYALLAAPADASPQGSGWGKYGSSGTLSNQYVTVNNQRLYEYDLTQASPSWAQAATGMASGDWFWQQFENYLYGINATAGIGRKKLSAGTNGHGDWGLLVPPTAPANAPTAPQNSSANGSYNFAGATLNVSGGASTNGGVQADGSLFITWPSSGAGPQTVSVQFATSPDRRPDLTYHDTIYQNIYGTLGFPSDIQLDVFSVNNTGGTRAVPWYSGALTSFPTFAWRVANIARTNRAQVTKLVYNVVVPSNGGTLRIRPLFSGGVWLSLGLTTNVTPNTDPTFKVLEYEYTYVDTSTDLESSPSPTLSIPASQQYHFGEWRDVTCASSAQNGVTKIRVYRKIGDTRYRLAELANPGSGTAVHTDKLAADEVTALTLFSPSVFPSGQLTAIAAWVQRLVVAAANTVYISRDSDPLSFVDQTTIYDPQDAARAFTTPVDDRRAETVLGLAAEDELYIVTDFSVRCLFGTTPDNWRLLKISNSEGAIGPRAWKAFQGGVIVFTKSGRLMYYRIGAQPSEISEKVRAKIGDEGIKAICTDGAVVDVTPDGQIEVRGEDGTYFILDTDGTWRGGKHTHPTHSTLFISGYLPRWIGTDGKLYEGGADSYTTDAGTPVTGYVLTKDKRMPRSSVTNFYLDAVQTLDPNDTTKTIYPKITPICKRTTKEGLTSYTARAGERNLRVGVNASGEEMQWKIEFDKDSAITEARATHERQSPARNL